MEKIENLGYKVKAKLIRNLRLPLYFKYKLNTYSIVNELLTISLVHFWSELNV